jgi:hypothetical protein
MEYLCFSAKNPYVLQDRWIASLSDGTTIFEDKTPGIESAWRRLGRYLLDEDLRITSLRLEAYGKSVHIGYLFDGTIDGYWQANKIASSLNGPVQDLYWKGAGYISGGQIYIVWIRQDGLIESETRPANGDRGNIYNR